MAEKEQEEETVWQGERKTTACLSFGDKLFQSTGLHGKKPNQTNTTQQLSKAAQPSGSIAGT